MAFKLIYIIYYISGQMKILEDQSAQTTIRAVGLAYRFVLIT